MSCTIDKIKEVIKKRILSLSNKIDIYYEGKIISVIDNIIRIIGLSHVCVYELIDLPNNLGQAIVFDLDKYIVSAVLLDFLVDIKVGMKVRSTGTLISVPVGPQLLGRLVNALGQEIDGLGPISKTQYYPIEYIAPSLNDRRYINRSLITGYKAIDSMIPIGLGQRELIIGDRKTGKTSIVIDIIISQRFYNIKCVYVSIGQKLSTIYHIVKKLNEFNALNYTIIVVAASSDNAIMQYIAPYAGCSMAEYFRNIGEDVIIIYDDLSKHAISYRQISLLLRRPPGREAYPGDIFYLHARLLERAAYVNADFIRHYNRNYLLTNTTGSLTALPIVETYDGDISTFIPTNIISITDGQIFLESNLFHSGIKPAINPGISVSRVGTSAQYPIMKLVTSSLRTILSQYYDLLHFTQFTSNLDINTTYYLNYGKRIVEVLKQSPYSPLSLFKQILIFFALKYKYLNHILITQISIYEYKLYQYVNDKYIILEDYINKYGLVNKHIIKTIKKILMNFNKKFFSN